MGDHLTIDLNVNLKGGEELWGNHFRREVKEALARIERALNKIIPAIVKEGDIIMGALSDKIHAVTGAINDAKTRIQQDVATLTQKIADLEALVAQGGATQADLDELDAAKTLLDQINPATPTTV